MGMLMSKRDRLKVDKKDEMRNKGISKMISEGGLGADTYYKIVKDSTEKDKDTETDQDKEDEET